MFLQPFYLLRERAFSLYITTVVFCSSITLKNEFNFFRLAFKTSRGRRALESVVSLICVCPWSLLAATPTVMPVLLLLLFSSCWITEVGEEWKWIFESLQNCGFRWNLIRNFGLFTRQQQPKWDQLLPTLAKGPLCPHGQHSWAGVRWGSLGSCSDKNSVCCLRSKPDHQTGESALHLGHWYLSIWPKFLE